MSTEKDKLKLSLQHKAELTTAMSFWKKKEVKDRAAEFFDSCEKFETKRTLSEWGKFTKSVVDEWNKNMLPKMLKAELIHFVRMIGLTIFAWYQYSKCKFNAKEEAINFIDKIEWTLFGTIDEVKTFKSSWLDNPNRDITKVYDFACHYAITDHIKELWDKIPANVQDRLYDNAIYNNFDQHILAYWKHDPNNDIDDLISLLRNGINRWGNNEDVYNIYVQNHSVAENMLRLSVHEGYFIVMKYFWEMLSKEEKSENVLKCACIVADRYKIYEGECETIKIYKMSQCVEICIFLMKQMTNQDKKSFFNETFDYNAYSSSGSLDIKNDILTMLLFAWPRPEFFMTVLEDILQLLDKDSEMDCKFLESITKKMVEDHKLGYPMKASIYRYLLRQAWFIIPASTKQKIPQVNSRFSSIGNLINVWDLDSIKLLLNDKAITDVRDQFIDLGSLAYEQLVIDDQFDKLDHLINGLFKFDENKKKLFKQKINPWYDLVKDKKFDFADKFLDWQSNTPEERQSFKNNINHIELCKRFFENDNFEVLDKLLDWKFESMEEKIECKEHFKSDIFTIKKVYNIWKLLGNNIDDVKETSFRFLNWIFESNEEIICFKKEKLVNIKINQFVIHELVMLEYHGIIDEFLSWCLLDDDKIEEIKQVVSEA